MALNILVDVEQAKKEVKELGDEILGLGDKAEQASKEVGDKLNFGASALDQIKGVGDQLKMMTDMLGGFANGLLKNSQQLGTFNQAQSDMRSLAVQTTKAISDQTSAINNQTSQLKGMVKSAQDAGAAQAKMAAAAKKTSDEFKASDQQIAKFIDSTVQLKTKLSDAVSPLDQYYLKLDALDKLKQLAVETDRKLGISEKQYIAGLGQAAAALEANSVAEAKRAAIKQKLIDVDIPAAKAEKDLAAAMKVVNSTLQQSVTPLQKYADQVAAIQKASSANKFDPTKGINPAQSAQALAGARTELEKTLTASTGASAGLKQLASDLGITTQGAAAFRAALEGTGLGFGIFTGQTIAAATAVYLISKALADTIRSGAEFDQTFQNLTVAMGQFSSTGATAFAGALKAQILDLASTTKYTADQVADAALILTKAGESPIQVYNNLAHTLDIAAATMSTVEEAARTTTEVMNAFFISSDRFGEVGDIIAKASTISNVSLEQMKRGLEGVGEIAVTAGLNLQQVAAMEALMAQVGVPGNRVAVELRQALATLADPTKKEAEALRTLIPNFDELHKSGINLVDMLHITNKAFQGLNAAAQQTIGVDIFGKRAASGGLALIKFAGDSATAKSKLNDLMATFNDAGGAAAEMAAKMTDTVPGAFEKLKAELSSIQAQAFGGFGDELQKSIEKLTSFIRANAPEIVSDIQGIASAFISFASFILEHGSEIELLLEGIGLRLLLTGVGSTIGVLGSLTSSLAAFFTRKAALQAADVIATEAFVSAEAVAYTELGTVAAAGATEAVAATATAGGAVAGLSGTLGSVAAFLTGPWGIAIAAAGVGVYALYEHFKEAEPQIQSTSDALIKFQGVADSLSGLNLKNLGDLTAGLSKDIPIETANVKQLADQLNGLNTRASDLRTKMAQPMRFEFVQALRDQLTGVETKIQSVQSEYDKHNLKLSELQTAYAKTGNQIQEFADAVLKPLAATKEQSDAIDKVIGGMNNTITTTDTLTSSLKQQASAFSAVLSPLELLSKQIRSFSPELDALVKAALALGPAFKDGAVPGIEAMIKQVSSGNLTSLKALTKVLTDIKDATAPKDHTKKDPLPDTGKDAELASLLKTITGEYEKQANSALGLNRELAELNRLQSAIAAGSGKVAEEMKKMGLSAAEAQQAIQWKKGQDVLTYLSDTLGALDPRFKNLKTAMGEAQVGTVSLETVQGQLGLALSKTNLSSAEQKQWYDKINGVLPSIADGTAKLNQELLAAEKATNEAFGAKSTSTLDGWAAQFHKTFTEMDAAGQKWAAQKLLMQELGKSVSDITTGQQKYADGITALNVLLKDGTINQQAYNSALYDLQGKFPEGKMEHANDLLQGQIAMFGQGPAAVELYTKAYQDFGGHLDQVTAGYIAAAQANAQLNAQMKTMQAVQGTFQTFAEGFSKMMATAFTGGIHSFKDFAHQLKDLFKQMLVELVAMEIKQDLFGSLFGMQSGGVGQGITSVFGSFFGGGNQGGSFGSIANYAGGGGGSFYGNGGTSQAGGFDLGSAIANAIGGSTGVSSTGGTAGGGSFGNTNFLSMLGGNNGLSFGQSLTNIWSGNGVGGTTMFGTSAPTGSVYQMGGYGVNMPYGGPMTYTPSTFGNVLGIAGGAYAGYQEYKAAGGGAMGVLGGATYGLGTIAAGGAAAGLLGGAGMAAGEAGAMTGAAGAMGAGAGAMAAIPVIGWIALAAMLVNMISGGKLFGTSWQAKNSQQGITVGPDGGSAFLKLYETKQGAFFSGMKKRTIDQAPGQDAIDAANGVYKNLMDSMTRDAKALGVAVLPAIDASFETITEYDKKGKAKSTKTLTTFMGQTYEESFEDFQKRIAAEGTISEVGASLAKQAGGNVTELNKVTGQLNDVVSKWRADAATLVDGAQFLLAVQKDVLNGQGVIRQGVDSLMETVKVVQDVQTSGESLSDTYSRVKASVTLVRSELGPFNVELGKTQFQFAEFSANLITALGGLSAAQQIIADFANTFGTVLGTQLSAGTYAMKTAKDKLTGDLKGLGLAADASAADFAAALEKVMSTLSPEDLAKWLNVGEDFAQIKNLQDNLASFMNGIDDQLSKFNGREYTQQLHDIELQMNANIKQASALGASESQLASIRQLAAYQEQQVITQLQQSITSLASQYNSMTPAGSTSQADMIAQTQQAQTDLYNAEMQRYQDSLAAIKEIGDYLKSLTVSDLSPGSYQDRLGAASSNFSSDLTKAQGGDTTALQNITSDADTYLKLAQGFYGSTSSYAQIYAFVTQALQGLQSSIAASAPPPSGNPGGTSVGSSSTSQTQSASDYAQQRYQLALQIAQQIGQLGLATDVDVVDLLKQYGVKLSDLAKDFHIDLSHFNDDTKTGLQVLAASLGISIPTLLTDMGSSIQALLPGFNLKMDDLLNGNLTGLDELAKFLGTNIVGALDALGIKLADIAPKFGIDIKNLTEATAPAIVALATAVGESSLDVITALKINLGDLAATFGVTVDTNGQTNLLALQAFSTALGINLVDLGDKLGVNIEWLAGQIALGLTTGLASIPSLPADIATQVAPFLEEIKNAQDPADLLKGITDLTTFVNNLPDDQKNALQPLLQNLGLTDLTDQATQQTDAQQSIDENTQSIKANTDVLPTHIVGMHSALNEISTGTDLVNAQLGSMVELLGQMLAQNKAVTTTTQTSAVAQATSGASSGTFVPAGSTQGTFSPGTGGTPHIPTPSASSSQNKSNAQGNERLARIEAAVNNLSKVVVAVGSAQIEKTGETNNHLATLNTKVKQGNLPSTGSRK